MRRCFSHLEEQVAAGLKQRGEGLAGCHGRASRQDGAVGGGAVDVAGERLRGGLAQS